MEPEGAPSLSEGEIFKVGLLVLQLSTAMRGIGRWLGDAELELG